MSMCFVEREHHDKAHMAALGGVVHTTPAYRVFQDANAYRPMFYMFRIAMRNCDVESSAQAHCVQARWELLFARMKRRLVGRLHPAALIKHVSKTFFDVKRIEIIVFQQYNQVLIKMQSRHCGLLSGGMPHVVQICQDWRMHVSSL